MTDQRDRLAEKKEPTMQDIERAAEGEAAYYVECYAEHFDPHLEPEQRAELKALFLKALTQYARPAAGKWRDSNGVDYDCCSDDTQEQTGYRTIVLEPIERERDPSDCPECGSLTVHLDVKPGRRCLNCGTVFSTPDAAQAERGEGLCYPFSTETCDRTGCTCRDDAREAGKERGE